MTDPADLHNQLEALADVAAGARAAKSPPEVVEAQQAMVELLVAAGYARRRAEQAITGWILLRQPGGARWPVLTMVAIHGEDGPLPYPEGNPDGEILDDEDKTP